MKRIFPFLFIVFIFSNFIIAQTTISPSKVVRSYKNDTTIPLRDMLMVHPGQGSFWEETGGIVPNETDIPKNTDGAPDIDPIYQTYNGSSATVPLNSNFDGIGNLFGGAPPDTDGDIGLNHYVQMINISFAIYDKQGNLEYGPASNSTIWNGFTGPWTGHNDGDPIILYDDLADRWLFSQFAIINSGPDYVLVAISSTSDPMGPYHRYAFQFTNMPDYPKLGVWQDGYYLSVNQFPGGGGASILERDEMLVGNPADMIFFNMGSGVSSLLPADNDGIPAPAGTPGYFLELRGSSGLNMYTVDVDWNNTANSSISSPVIINTSGYNASLNQVTQKGTSQKLDDLSDRLMFRLQYRNFNTYQAMVCNHSVNVGSGRAGVRWYELRNDGSGWDLYQEGTYAPDDGENRWMGSIAMDAAGNIALGYSVASTNTYASIRYTGRYAGDPLGEMTMTEGEIMAGNGSQTGSDSYGRGRWGDYSAMTVDPATQAFWFTTEYIPQTGTWPWKTRVASFNLEIDEIAPDGITDLAIVPGSQTSNSFGLMWTATGDDGIVGNASRYDLRMSNSPITTDVLFENATPVANVPLPGAPGSAETFTLENLDVNSDYYFAIKVIDDQNNYSPISNSVIGSTLGEPVIAVTPPSLDFVVDPGTNWTSTINVANTSAYPSTLEISSELTNNSFPKNSIGAKIVSTRSKIASNINLAKGEPNTIHGYSFAGSGGPDGFEYSWKDSDEPDGPEYVWNDISASGDAVEFFAGNLDDGWSHYLSLGFQFDYYGNTYTSVIVSTNGFISFSGLSNSYRANEQIPNDSDPNNIIAAFWDDLDARTQGTAYYLAGPDKFIVQYEGFQKYYSAASGGSSGSYTFQIVLNANGKIQIYYKEMVGAKDEATVGIENEDGTIGLGVVYNSDYPPSNEFAIQFAIAPEWVISNDLGDVLIWNGNSIDIELDFITDFLDPGQYSMDLELTTNIPSKSVIVIPITMTVNDLVPVELTSFNASTNGTLVTLNWITATETNNDGFEIQRKYTENKNADWDFAGFVQGKGTISNSSEYKFVDDLSDLKQGVVKYRLKQIDLDGSFDYSNVVEVEILPVSFVLNQNYPNPFNPTTTIEYALPFQSRVKISIYNVLGELLQNIVNEVQAAGYQKIEFGASNLTSGIYIYRMEAQGNGESFVQNKRMVLIK